MLEEVAALKDITKRQEHLIAELNHALHGKRSEKLTEDERQLAFEDLSIALAEVEAEKETRAAKAGDGTTKPARQRTIGNLPAALPRIEEIIEPDSLICPCGCGVMHKIGEDRSERLDIVPAQLRVIVTVRMLLSVFGGFTTYEVPRFGTTERRTWRAPVPSARSSRSDQWRPRSSPRRSPVRASV